MNSIYMSEDTFTTFTDEIESEEHRHGMLQIFICLEGLLNIQIEKEKVEGSAVIVDSDVPHCFETQNKMHFTMLIEVTSCLAQQLQANVLKDKKYWIIDEVKVEGLRQIVLVLKDNHSQEAYGVFFEQFFKVFGIVKEKVHLKDERISTLIKRLKNCDCSEHSIELLAREVALSKSRLAHLFKEEVGMPLNSYIVLHKLQKAYAYIAQGYSITDAALRAGFDSPSHLAYTNKKLTGMSAKNIIKDSEFLKVLQEEVL